MTGRFADLARERAAAAGGAVGAIVTEPNGAEILSIDPDGTFPAASVIKLPIAIVVYEDSAAGRLSLDERLPVGERVGGSGMLQELAGVTSVTVRDLAALMMMISDNTATNHLIDRVGLERVNAWLRAHGCERTTLARKLFDMEARTRGLENVMTPRETASLLAWVVRDAEKGGSVGTEVLRLLEHNQDRHRLGSLLPWNTTLGHKDGWGSDPDPVENDVGVVTGKRRVIAVGFTFKVHPVLARRVLGLVGLAAADAAGVDLSGLPPAVLAGA